MPVASLPRPTQKLFLPENKATTVKGSSKNASSTSRRTVRFKASVSVRPIRHVANMSDDEVRNVWYNKKEYDTIKREMMATVKLVTAGLLKDSSDEKHCPRGLEFRTRAGAKERRQNKTDGLSAVMDEQESQREEGINNPEWIRDAFLDENLHCRQKALKRGIADYKEVQRILAEEC